MAVQKVRRDKGGRQPAESYIFLYSSIKTTHHLGTGFFIHKCIFSAVKKVQFISDRMSYITLRGRGCDIVHNVNAPTEDKSDDTKERFYEELEHVLDQFLKYCMKILLGDLNTQVGREDIFKLTNENRSLHEISNDDAVRVVILPHKEI
jgi:exonuclease III